MRTNSSCDDEFDEPFPAMWWVYSAIVVASTVASIAAFVTGPVWANEIGLAGTWEAVVVVTVTVLLLIPAGVSAAIADTINPNTEGTR